MATDEREAAQRTLDDLFEVWIVPEVKKRQAAGELPSPYHVAAAQVIFYPVDKPVEIRLNQEVRARLLVETNEGVRQDEPVNFITQVDNISHVELPPDEDPNAAHITAVRIKTGWAIFFDATYNKEKALRLVSAARQFHRACRESFRKNHRIAAADCLFSCTELLAKAELIRLCKPALVKKSNHRAIAQGINLWGKLGNINQQVVHIFKKLSVARYPSRYEAIDPEITAAEFDSWIDTIEAELTRIVDSIDRSHPPAAPHHDS